MRYKFSALADLKSVSNCCGLLPDLNRCLWIINRISAVDQYDFGWVVQSLEGALSSGATTSISPSYNVRGEPPVAPYRWIHQSRLIASMSNLQSTGENALMEGYCYQEATRVSAKAIRRYWGSQNGDLRQLVKETEVKDLGRQQYENKSLQRKITVGAAGSCCFQQQLEWFDRRGALDPAHHRCWSQRELFEGSPVSAFGKVSCCWQPLRIRAWEPSTVS